MDPLAAAVTPDRGRMTDDRRDGMSWAHYSMGGEETRARPRGARCNCGCSDGPVCGRVGPGLCVGVGFVPGRGQRSLYGHYRPGWEQVWATGATGATGR